MAARIIPDVVREHVELAAFQWAQRDTLAHADPPAAPEVIAGIDARLEANLDAIRIAGAAAWPVHRGVRELPRRASSSSSPGWRSSSPMASVSSRRSNSVDLAMTTRAD